MQRTGRHAHWLDGEPITRRDGDGRRHDRMRSVEHGVDGARQPRRRLGVHEPADGPRHVASASSHAALLRRAAREHAGRPAALTAAFAADTERELAPYHRATLATDRERLAEIDALLAGESPPPANPLVRAMRRRCRRLPRARWRSSAALRCRRRSSPAPGSPSACEAAAGVTVRL